MLISTKGTGVGLFEYRLTYETIVMLGKHEFVKMCCQSWKMQCNIPLAGSYEAAPFNMNLISSLFGMVLILLAD
jgi:hypothetical protein